MALQLGNNDRKDRIIQQQLDLIRTLTSNNLKRMDADFWGPAASPAAKNAALEESAPAPADAAPKAEQPKDQTAAGTGDTPAAETQAELPPKEDIAALKEELESYIGLDAVKKEVENLINMVQIYQKRKENDLPCTDMSLHMVFSGNPGLESRFNRYLHFDDYTIAEMMRIFEMQCKKGCYELDEEAKKAVQLLIAERNTNAVSFGNARGVRNIFEQILTAQCNRLSEQEELTREDLMKITAADVAAVRALPEKKTV